MNVIRIHEQVRLHAGYLRGIAYDLPRSTHFFLPKALVHVLVANQGASLEVIDAEAQKAGINLPDWLDLLRKEEIIFDCPAAFNNNFPELDLVIQRPLLLDTAVLAIPFARMDVLRVLERAGCQHLALRMVPGGQNRLKSFWRSMERISITSVSIHFDEEVDASLIFAVIPEREANPKLRFVSAKGTSVGPSFSGDVSIHHLPDRTGAKRYEPCLTLNQEVYMEALQWNVYHNRKIFVDSEGRIGHGGRDFGGRHTPSKLAPALEHHLLSMGTPASWTVRKDEVTVCRDCELRYMCVDPRIPERRSDGTLFHKEECSYNPYIGKWQDEAGYRDLAGCGVINDDRPFSAQHDRIAAINAELWGL